MHDTDTDRAVYKMGSHDAVKRMMARKPLALIKRVLPVMVLLAGTAIFFGFGLHKYVTFDALRQHRGELMAFVASMPVMAAALYVLIYIAAIAFSLPGGVVLTLTGGFLFGGLLGTALTVVSATIGATALFLAARTALGDVLRARAGPFLGRMEQGFKENALAYMLVLRLIPAFPFFVVNLVPAFLGVPLRTYVIGTFIGIIPGTFVFTSIGAGLGSIFDSMQEFTLKGALTPEVLTALIGLAVLSLIPVAYKKLRSKNTLSNAIPNRSIDGKGAIRMPSRRALLLSGAGLVALAIPAAILAIARDVPKPAIYTGIIPGVAVGGYDPVAYFSKGSAVPGRSDIVLEYAGVSWRFATEENRVAFRIDPNRYAPQYGGYCAYAVARNSTAEGDPKVWSIVDGKLYLNASPRVRSKWERDARGYIVKADANWPAVLTR